MRNLATPILMLAIAFLASGCAARGGAERYFENTLAGAAIGAGVGAGAGSMLGGVGAIPGAGAGAIIGAGIGLASAR